jgi:hypothetical protein
VRGRMSAQWYAMASLFLIGVGVLFAGTVPPAQSQATMPNPAKVAELKMALRNLYINHIFWVRDLAMSTRLGEKAAVSEADEYGLKNAEAIGHSIAPFYGQAAGDKFATLFVGHYSAVKAYMMPLLRIRLGAARQ